MLPGGRKDQHGENGKIDMAFLLAEVVILLLMVLFPSLVTVPMNFFLG